MCFDVVDETTLKTQDLAMLLVFSVKVRAKISVKVRVLVRDTIRVKAVVGVKNLTNVES